MASELYEHDFYLWTRDQAEALRGRDGARNQLDYDLLAEEIEDLGSEQRNAVRSFVIRILQHLYKLETSPADAPRNHWRTEIRQFRIEMEARMTGAIRRLILEDLAALHAKAAKVAQADLADREPGLVVDASRTWTLPQITGEADDPLDH